MSVRQSHRITREVNLILAGWVAYFRTGHASRHFTSVRDWVEKKVRRHLERAGKWPSFGWKRWGREWPYNGSGRYNDSSNGPSAAIYKYSAKDMAGRVIAGTIEADTDSTVVRHLRNMGFFITNIERQAKRRNVSDFLQSVLGVGLRELAIFSRQFSTMINAGVPIVHALSILEQQTSSKTLREIVTQIRLDVEGGRALSDALARYPKVFSTLYVNMVQAGETGGVLDQVLLRIATFLEKEVALRQKIRAALVYPALLTVTALAGLMFMTVVILPQFQQLFKSLGGSEGLPLPTQIAMGVSLAIRRYWYVVIGGLAALGYLSRRYVRTPSGRARYDYLKLHLPVLGELNRKIVVARFSRTLGTLVASGVPIVQALDVVAKAIGNTVIGRAVEAVGAGIREGQTIALPLQLSGVFPPMLVQMTKVGEETGALEQMLEKVAEFYDIEVEATVQSLTSLLEPVLIIFMGLIVGAMVVSLYLPIFELASGSAIR